LANAVDAAEDAGGSRDTQRAVAAAAAAADANGSVVLESYEMHFALPQIEGVSTKTPIIVASGVCVTCAPFCGDGTRAFNVEEGRREELDKVALEVVVVELLELTKLTLDVAEADETCCLGHQYLEMEILIETIHRARSQQRG
jgi:hypothetical protein